MAITKQDMMKAKPCATFDKFGRDTILHPSPLANREPQKAQSSRLEGLTKGPLMPVLF